MTTTSPAPPLSDVVRDPLARVRTRVAAAALGAAALTVSALLVTTPWGDRLDSSADEVVNYDDLLSVRDAAWTSMMADAFAFAVIGLCLALTTAHLVRTRGRVAALVGGLLTTAGGICFAMGEAAFASFSWFTSSSGLSEEAGRSLVDYANDHSGHMIGVTLVGFALYTLGTLVLGAALLRARAVPAVALAAYVVLTFAQFAPLSGRGIDYLQIVMMLVLAGYAVLVWRRA